jgi:hypothetical protein
LIAYVQSTKPPLKVLTHEIHHAQFALTPGYREVVQQFWNNKILKKDQVAIREKLGRVYNLNQDILLDEFQAYLIQEAADQDMLRAFVDDYQSGLLKAFSDAGITLVNVVD